MLYDHTWSEDFRLETDREILDALGLNQHLEVTRI